MVFSSSHVLMGALDHKKGWAPKNWCFQIVLENILESPLDYEEIEPVHPKGNHSWTFTGRTEAEAPILWPPDMKSYSLEKTLMLGKVEGKRRSGWQRMRWLGCITNLMDMNLNKLREMVKDRKAWCTAVDGVTQCWTGGSDRITTTDGMQGMWHGGASLVPGMRKALNKWGALLLSLLL